MKKTAAILLLALTAGSLLYGCKGQTQGKGAGFSPESSGIYVSRDGKVESALVEACEADGYDENSLKAFLDEAVAGYAEEHPAQGEEPAVSLKSCSVKDGRMTAVFEYASPQDMIEFAREEQDDSMGLTSLEILEVGQAVSQGKLGDESFVDGENKSVSAEDIKKEEKAKVVIAQGEGLIGTEGKILYVSSGVELEPSGNGARVTGETSYIIFK